MRAKRLIYIILSFALLIQLAIPLTPAAAATGPTAYQTFNKNLTKELNRYIKKSGGTITLQYRDLTTGEEFKIGHTRMMSAASTTKLPLALYVMELAAEKKINLNQKLTYKKHHYYGGSGVIQYQKVGSRYTIRDLVKKSMVHSDNIAFIMLREKVGRQNFHNYMKKIGGKYAYPNGRNMTSAQDLVVYANHLYYFSQKNKLGKDLVGYLKKTDFNTTIPKGIKGAQTAHKVGMIPKSRIYNDIGIVYDKNPFALAVMTNHIEYKKSQKVIAEIAAIVHKHHKIKNKASYVKAKNAAVVFQKPKGKQIASLRKGETYKISAHRGKMYEIFFGGKKAYINKSAVTPYAKSNVKFLKKSIKKNGVVKTRTKGTIRTSASSKSKAIASLNKGQTMYVDSMKGSYYKVQIGNRLGYIHKNQADLQFTAAIKQFKVQKANTALYKKEKGNYIKIGTLTQGRVFTILKDSGKYIEVRYGSSKAYVVKASTVPVLKTKVSSTSKTTTLGTLVLQKDMPVYSKTNDPNAKLGVVSKGQSISYYSTSEQCYRVNFAGRVGYISKQQMEDIHDTEQ